MKKQPWPTAVAIQNINSIGSDARLTITYTSHAKARLNERGLIVSDVLYALARGFVFGDATASTQEGLFKYEIETRTPNSNNRKIRVVVIPDMDRLWIKIVTVMWADE